MISFLHYLEEADRLRHLSHAEDRMIESGRSGFRQAFNTLHGLHKFLRGKESGITLNTKADGAPSVVFGRNPDNNRFFVASKSAWNKTPKLNYTEKDIETNHAKAPGLVVKLKQALKHLPKVTPKTGVYQGDFMYSKGEVKDVGNKREFTPNTITYRAGKDTPYGRKMETAKIGVAVHTAYHGPSFSSLQPDYEATDRGFKSHPDVHVTTFRNTGKAEYTDHRQSRVRWALGRAFQRHRDINYNAIKGSEPHMQMYVNNTVRTNQRPTVKGYYEFLRSRPDAKSEHFDAVRNNTKDFKNVFAAHGYLELAKNTIVHALDAHQDLEHSIGGQPSGPEGYVAIKKNVPTKIIKRRSDKLGPAFSASNFFQGRFQK